jgi:hypothetical protein
MRALQTRERAKKTARSTATSTIAVGDLPDDLELSSDGMVSASWWRDSAGEREWRGGE